MQVTIGFRVFNRECFIYLISILSTLVVRPPPRTAVTCIFCDVRTLVVRTQIIDIDLVLYLAIARCGNFSVKQGKEKEEMESLYCMPILILGPE
jgi:hypothetical protein